MESSEFEKSAISKRYEFGKNIELFVYIKGYKAWMEPFLEKGGVGVVIGGGKLDI